jgi:hypothetical protein
MDNPLPVVEQKNKILQSLVLKTSVNQRIYKNINKHLKMTNENFQENKNIVKGINSYRNKSISLDLTKPIPFNNLILTSRDNNSKEYSIRYSQLNTESTEENLKTVQTSLRFKNSKYKILTDEFKKEKYKMKEKLDQVSYSPIKNQNLNSKICLSPNQTKTDFLFFTNTKIGKKFIYPVMSRTIENTFPKLQSTKHSRQSTKLYDICKSVKIPENECEKELYNINNHNLIHKSMINKYASEYKRRLEEEHSSRKERVQKRIKLKIPLQNERIKLLLNTLQKNLS